MFDFGNTEYPRKWKEYSLECKLFFFYHICMMFLFILGHSLTIQMEIAFVVLLAGTLSIISIRHRIRNNWHWPGADPKDVAKAVVTAALGLFFLGAATPRISPLDPEMFPWFAAGGGIISFWILFQLKAVHFAESAFLRQCGERPLLEPQEAKTAPPEPAWKKRLRLAFSLYFLAVWIAGVSFFWKFNVAFRDGSPKPTPTKTETLTDHGHTVYITPQEKRTINLLKRSMMLGGPSAVLGAVFLHFVLGVKLFPNTPSLAEWRKNKGN